MMQIVYWSTEQGFLGRTWTSITVYIRFCKVPVLGVIFQTCHWACRESLPYTAFNQVPSNRLAEQNVHIQTSNTRRQHIIIAVSYLLSYISVLNWRQISFLVILSTISSALSALNIEAAFCSLKYYIWTLIASRKFCSGLKHARTASNNLHTCDFCSFLPCC